MIPPILIILSLAGIIIFFMKKAPQIARLSDEDALEKERLDRMATAGFFGRLGLKIKNIRWSGLKSVFLALSEKLTRRARIIFLRLESKSKSLNDSIRSKRGKQENTNSERKSWEGGQNEEDVILDKVNNYQPKKKSYLAGMKKALKKEKVPEKNAYDDSEERIIKPMVSDRVVNPNGRAEMKDRLEDLLIERIAANPKDVEAYERLGEYYMEIDSLNDAKECFKQVLKLDPKNRNVKYRMRVLETMIRRS
jgi:tetratricopeptide (TPR) repeat protein